MTSARKRVARTTDARIRSRGRTCPIVVSIEPGGHLLGFRLYRHRQVFYLNTADCFVRAVQDHVRRERAEKKKGKQP